MIANVNSLVRTARINGATQMLLAALADPSLLLLARTNPVAVTERIEGIIDANPLEVTV